MWMIFAVLSAVFAALTSILAKVGIEGVNSNPGNCNPNHCCSNHGMGHGLSYSCAEWTGRNQ